MLTDLDDTYRMRAEIRQQIAGADEKVAAIRKLLESMLDAPAEPLRRNVLEQHAHEALIRARRQREFDSERHRLRALEAQAVNTANQLRGGRHGFWRLSQPGNGSSIAASANYSSTRCGAAQHTYVISPTIIPTEAS